MALYSIGMVKGIRNFKIIIGYGLLVWVVPFIAGFALFPLRGSNRIFFESIMPVVLVGVVAFSAVRVRAVLPTTGWYVCVLWLVVLVILDQAFFSWGPQRMNFADYWVDIGFVYLVVPIIFWATKIAPQSDKPELPETATNNAPIDNPQV